MAKNGGYGRIPQKKVGDSMGDTRRASGQDRNGGYEAKKWGIRRPPMSDTYQIYFRPDVRHNGSRPPRIFRPTLFNIDMNKTFPFKYSGWTNAKAISPISMGDTMGDTSGASQHPFFFMLSPLVQWLRRKKMGDTVGDTPYPPSHPPFFVRY